MGTAIRAAVVAALEAKSDTDRWQDFDAKARREESRYQAAALALFLREREQIVQRVLGAGPTDAHHAIADPYIEAAVLLIAADYAIGGAYHTAWLRRYRALIGQTVQVGARGVSARVGLSFNLRNPNAQAAIQRRVTKLAGNVSATTLQRVRDVITQARTEGVGVSEIARRIRADAFDGSITRTRAQTIARTETVGALNEGAYTAAQTSGVMRSKRWLSQRDGRVRESHVEAEEAGWIGLDAVFPNGLTYPHAPDAPAAEVVNCRCAMLYSDLAPNEANAP